MRTVIVFGINVYEKKISPAIKKKKKKDRLQPTSIFLYILRSVYNIIVENIIILRYCVSRPMYVCVVYFVCHHAFRNFCLPVGTRTNFKYINKFVPISTAWLTCLHISNAQCATRCFVLLYFYNNII